MTDNNQKTNESLWLSCGLCYNGTLFGKVLLQPMDDPERDVSKGVEVIKKGSKYSFNLACARFENGCCQIYEERFSNCRTFRCSLLRKFEDDGISWTNAQEKIVRVQDLRENLKNEVTTNLPEYEDLSFHHFRVV